MTDHAPLTPWSAPAPGAPLPDELATPRLTIRRFRPEDARALFDAVNVSRSTLLPWLPWAKTGHLTIYDTIHDIVRFQRDSERLGCAGATLVLGLFLRGGEHDGALVGGTGFHTVVPERRQAEIGYWMHVGHRRQGLCAEATRWMLSWMLTPAGEALAGADGREVPGWGFRRVEILCAGGNEGSRAVPGKLGLREEQHRLSDRWIDGQGWDDTRAWGVLDREWDRARHALRTAVDPG